MCLCICHRFATPTYGKTMLLSLRLPLSCSSPRVEHAHPSHVLWVSFGNPPNHSTSPVLFMLKDLRRRLPLSCSSPPVEPAQPFPRPLGEFGGEIGTIVVVCCKCLCVYGMLCRYERSNTPPQQKGRTPRGKWTRGSARQTRKS